MTGRAKSKNRLGLVALVSPLVLAACAAPKLGVGVVAPDRSAQSQAAGATSGASTPANTGRVEFLQPAQRLNAPAASTPRTPEATNAQIADLIPDDPVEATLPPQPMPQFIDTVLGNLIQTPYILGPGVAEMRDIVSLRGSIRTSKRSLFAMMQLALKDFGVTLAIENGAVRVIRNEPSSTEAPYFFAGRTLPETPSSSRPVIQFFELKSIEVNSMMTLLQDAYPNQDKVKFSARQDINTLVVTGPAREVAAAAQVIDGIDQPRFSGANVARISPVYWSAERLADAISQALTTEGYQAGRGGSMIQRAVTFLPVPYTNQLMVFSNMPDAFERALFWMRELDQPSAFGDQENVFVYTVENTSADELGRLVAGIQAAQTQGRPPGAPGDPTAPPTPQGQGPQPSTMGRVTIDPAGNRLLYRGTPSEFQRWRDMVVQLDTPPQQVLVEMTIAEVTLTDETRFGVEWFVRDVLSNGQFNVGTLGGLGIGGDALSLELTKTDLNVVLSAFASNNNINILSTPRVVARSGGRAFFQVGTDVPIITSQRAAPTQQPGGATDVLQSVQYRQTGVILNIEPTIYGGDRIDLKINQEVSNQASNPNTAIASPLILNRSVETQISLREGSTAVLGGLIQDNYTRGNTGVPLLKDIPVLGGAFRSDTVTSTKTELLILVTPYIVRDGDELSRAAGIYSDSINRAFNRRGPHAYTLLPWGLRGQSLGSPGQPGSFTRD